MVLPGIAVLLVVVVSVLYWTSQQRFRLINQMLAKRGLPPAIQPYESHFSKRAYYDFPRDGYDLQIFRVEGLDRKHLVDAVAPGLRADYELIQSSNDSQKSVFRTFGRGLPIIDVYDGETPGHCFLVLNQEYEFEPPLKKMKDDLGFPLPTLARGQLDGGVLTPEVLENLAG
jgi:hypothetical protein